MFKVFDLVIHGMKVYAVIMGGIYPKMSKGRYKIID